MLLSRHWIWLIHPDQWLPEPTWEQMTMGEGRARLLPETSAWRGFSACSVSHEQARNPGVLTQVWHTVKAQRCSFISGDVATGTGMSNSFSMCSSHQQFLMSSESNSWWSTLLYLLGSWLIYRCQKRWNKPAYYRLACLSLLYLQVMDECYLWSLSSSCIFQTSNYSQEL